MKQRIELWVLGYIILGLSIACGPSPIDLENCATIEHVVGAEEVPDTPEALEAWLSGIGDTRELPDGYDCAYWVVTTDAGALIGYAYQYVTSRTRTCWLFFRCEAEVTT